MKIYLDDERKTPNGWVRAYWADEVIKLIKNNDVTAISLDHDLGDDSRSTGYDVLVWLEEELMSGRWDKSKKFPMIDIHSMNPVAVVKMRNLARKLYFFAEDNNLL